MVELCGRKGNNLGNQSSPHPREIDIARSTGWCHESRLSKCDKDDSLHERLGYAKSERNFLPAISEPRE
jgi:hypothetical protein